jgi:zinc/manganese transport system substrate-binding protein
MKALDAEIRSTLDDVPPDRRRVISSHDAFGYFGDAYGIEFIPVAGLSNQAEPSARDVARIIRAAREEAVSGVFIENMSNPALARQIAKESKAILGGTLYADALSPPDQPAATYLGMFSWNAGRLSYVLKQSPAQ